MTTLADAARNLRSLAGTYFGHVQDGIADFVLKEMDEALAAHDTATSPEDEKLLALARGVDAWSDNLEESYPYHSVAIRLARGIIALIERKNAEKAAAVAEQRERDAQIVDAYKRDDPEYAICAAYRLYLAEAIRGS